MSKFFVGQKVRFFRKHLSGQNKGLNGLRGIIQKIFSQESESLAIVKWYNWGVQMGGPSRIQYTTDSISNLRPDWNICMAIDTILHGH